MMEYDIMIRSGRLSSVIWRTCDMMEICLATKKLTGNYSTNISSKEYFLQFCFFSFIFYNLSCCNRTSKRHINQPTNQQFQRSPVSMTGNWQNAGARMRFPDWGAMKKKIVLLSIPVIAAPVQWAILVVVMMKPSRASKSNTGGGPVLLSGSLCNHAVQPIQATSRKTGASGPITPLISCCEEERELNFKGHWIYPEMPAASAIGGRLERNTYRCAYY